MPDNDVSHAVELRLDALDARITALEGGSVEEDTEEVSNELPEEVPMVATRRGRKGATETTTDELFNPEGV